MLSFVEVCGPSMAGTRLRGAAGVASAVSCALRRRSAVHHRDAGLVALGGPQFAFLAGVVCGSARRKWSGLVAQMSVNRDADGSLTTEMQRSAVAFSQDEMHRSAVAFSRDEMKKLVPPEIRLLSARSWTVWLDQEQNAVVAELSRKTRFVTKDAEAAAQVLEALRDATQMKRGFLIIAISGESPVCSKAAQYLRTRNIGLLVHGKSDVAVEAVSDEKSRIRIASDVDDAKQAKQISPRSRALKKKQQSSRFIGESMNVPSERVDSFSLSNLAQKGMQPFRASSTTHERAPPRPAPAFLASRMEQMTRKDSSASTFRVESPFVPAGDQQPAIDALLRGLQGGSSASAARRFQLLRGATGTGKTFVMANLIAQYGRPALVIAPNKILAEQLCKELRAFLPNNAVEFFVSYYTYYRPEAYNAKTDTFIDKTASVDDRLDRLRHSATRSLHSRRDVVIVASVSCLYGLGLPSSYRENALRLKLGQEISVTEFCERLAFLQYERATRELRRGTYRDDGNVVEVAVAWAKDQLYRIEFSNDRVSRLSIVAGNEESEALTDDSGSVMWPEKHIKRRLARSQYESTEKLGSIRELIIFAAKHFITPKDQLERAIQTIQQEFDAEYGSFMARGEFLKAQRLKERVESDLQLLREQGYCSGVENYSRHLAERAPGSAPFTLRDYFQENPLVLIDESHVTVPQIRAMYNADASRKSTLVAHGFRLPSCLDNRPLRHEEFWSSVDRCVFVSATPGEIETAWSLADYQACRSVTDRDSGELSSSGVYKGVELVVRPTGVLDPTVEVRSSRNQLRDLLREMQVRSEKGEATLVTTITKKMSEDVTEFLRNNSDLRVAFMHSDVDTIGRMHIVEQLQSGELDGIVGVNLLREGLDMPSVSLVAVFDADKQGFLRSETSLIQTMGRAARNINGHAILYADTVTSAMRRAIDEAERRRAIQLAHNAANNQVPTPVLRKQYDLQPRSLLNEVKSMAAFSDVSSETSDASATRRLSLGSEFSDDPVLLEEQMKAASERKDFALAAMYRDRLTACARLRDVEL